VACNVIIRGDLPVGSTDTERRSMPPARNNASIQNRRMRDAPGSTGLFAKPLMAVNTAFIY